MRSNERARREMEKEVNSEGSRRRRWRREGLPHRAALNMNIIMRTGFVVVPLLRSSSFGRSPVLLLSRLAAPHPLVLSHPPLFPFTSALYTYMRARCTAPRRAVPCRAGSFGNNNKTRRVTVPVKLPPRTELNPLLSATARFSDASRSVGLCHSSWRDYARLPDRITAPNHRSTGQ